MSESHETTDRGSKRGKLHRVAEKYGIEDVEDEILERRNAPRDERDSLRDLAEFFNKSVLEAALKGSSEDPLEGEIDNLYRLLTDDDVSEGMRVQARRRLDRRGVAVDELESDFISYQTINRFLDAHPGVEDSPPAETTPEEKMERLYKLRSRLVSVTESTLSQLQKGGTITLGDFDIYVTVNVVCNDCGTTRSLRDLFDSGGCDCQ